MSESDRASHPAVIAVDIGGTSAKGALVDIDGHVLNSSRIATGGSGAETVTRIADCSPTSSRRPGPSAARSSARAS